MRLGRTFWQSMGAGWGNPRPVGVSNGLPPHGGNLSQEARRLGMQPAQLLDASASLVPFPPPDVLGKTLAAAIRSRDLRDYPDRDQADLRSAIASWHDVDPEQVLGGNGAAELFTWVGRDAAVCGTNALPQPGFADYFRALACWGGAIEGLPLPLEWGDSWPQPFPFASPNATDVVWITNPHNPTGQLWSRCSLEPLLESHSLVICDEAFLPLVPGGEDQSLLALVADHPNLVVIRSLTKLFAIAGLRLGYAIAAPDRLRRWRSWRDPWPVNGLAMAAGIAVMNDPVGLQRWQKRVQQWVQEEGTWLREQLDAIPGVKAYPSAANYLLIQGEQSLLELREQIAAQGVLLRDCRSFEGLGDRWLRIGLQTRRDNRRIMRAFQRVRARGL